MSPNITSEKLDEIMSTLPEKMEEAEISALTLTIHNAYLEEPAEIINNLIATIYSYGMSIGISYPSISEGLRRTADMQDEDYQLRMRN
jgi:hypothetical protein